ncbi:MAG: FtsW/RodA/SpoVE family cell cycle protein, partial [Planctomycetota bacterium]|nr:FtsW/RodA/SpoVE family cell cycle protein [Planctomycetota bacterium]
ICALSAIAIPPALYYAWHNFAHIQRRWQDWVAGTADGTGYQTFMSMVALGSGGPYGMGLGQGQAKLFFLPDSHTDFILAIVGQEIGIIGTGAILLLFVLWTVEGMRLVALASSRFERLLAFGIVILLGLQAAFNMAVVTASIPPKGISLPFVSFGGSGLCVAWAATGLLVAISRNCASAGGAEESEMAEEPLNMPAPALAPIAAEEEADKRLAA